MRPSVRSEQGQATVELVLALPVVLLLVLAVVQVGIVARERVMLAHAAREAARHSAVDPDPSSALASARGAGGLDPDRLSVSLQAPGPGGPRPGDRLTVVVGYRAPTEVPIIGRLVGDVDLRTEVVVRVE